MPRKLAKETKKSIKKLLGREQINSGAGINKGDGLRELGSTINFGMYSCLLIESKATEKKSYVLKLKELEKIRQEAQNTGDYMPIFQTIFIDENKKSHEYITIRQEDFNDLLIWIKHLQTGQK